MRASSPPAQRPSSCGSCAASRPSPCPGAPGHGRAARGTAARRRPRRASPRRSQPSCCGSGPASPAPGARPRGSPTGPIGPARHAPGRSTARDARPRTRLSSCIPGGRRVVIVARTDGAAATLLWDVTLPRDPRRLLLWTPDPGVLPRVTGRRPRENARADGSRKRRPARITLAGDHVDFREDRLLGEHAERLGQESRSRHWQAGRRSQRDGREDEGLGTREPGTAQGQRDPAQGVGVFCLPSGRLLRNRLPGSGTEFDRRSK